ncbi:MAG: dual-specificity RNA methyltransferase RlmN [Planctomycetota bacterium]|jgi:23S rRNA (adenine2503-C2)-methyltransferase
MNQDLKDKTLDELEQIVVDLGQKKYLAQYIFHFIHGEGATEVSQITPLSKAFRAQLLEQGYRISNLDVLNKLTDKDGTIKYVFALDTGRIETVLLHDGRRRTLCVSTQVGCAMDCRFCATAQIPFQRNLTAAEIVDQVNVGVEGVPPSDRGQDARDTAGRISNIVYMGMGEPLANYAAVVKSLRMLNHPKGKNIGIRHITISTCGLVPAIRKLAGEAVCPRLAVSLNAPTDPLRTTLMPINAKYPIADLLAAVRFYQSRTRQRVTFEYVMIKDMNDLPDHAKMLPKLLERVSCNVNLIEHNPYPGCEFAATSSTRIKQFASICVSEWAGVSRQPVASSEPPG